MDLTKTYRSEKESQALTSLAPSFYQDALSHIKKLEENVEASQGIESQLIIDNIKAERNALKRINDIRIKKILSAVISDAYRDEPKHAHDSMLPSEKAFYEVMVEGIRSLRV